MKKYPTIRPPKPTTCAVIIDKEGTLCGDPIERLNGQHPYCKFHLNRAYKNKGDTQGSRKKQRGVIEGLPTTCGIIDPDGTLCTNDSANPRGKHGRLCRKHVRRKTLYGDVHGGQWQIKTCELFLPDGTQCPLDNKGKVNGKGPSMCELHWRRTRKWGDPRVDLPLDYHRGLNTCEVILGYEPKKGELCPNFANAYGVCTGHNHRGRKSGDVDDTPIVPKNIFGDERFLYRADPANGFVRIGELYDGTPCHHWLGAKSRRGYGTSGATSKVARSRLVHRRIWETHIGPIPEGHHIDHMCHNRDCFNLKHLRCLSPKEHVVATRTVVDLRTSKVQLAELLEKAEARIAELEEQLV